MAAALGSEMWGLWPEGLGLTQVTRDRGSVHHCQVDLKHGRAAFFMKVYCDGNVHWLVRHVQTTFKINDLFFLISGGACEVRPKLLKEKRRGWSWCTGCRQELTKFHLGAPGLPLS